MNHIFEENSAPHIYQLNDVAPPVTMEMFAFNRKRLIHELKSLAPRSIVLLKGAIAYTHYNTDSEYPFRQESYFHWTFGVREPGFWGAIDVASEKSYLFIPKFFEGFQMWMGNFEESKIVKKNYGVDEVYYISEITFVLAPLNSESILILKYENSKRNINFSSNAILNKNLNIDDDILYPLMNKLRLLKTSYEIDLLRYVTKISSEAHIFVMKTIQNGMFEFQAEALFLYYIHFVGGCRPAYTCICGSGQNSSVFHYGYGSPPNKKIEDGDICLFDMAASYYGYSADLSIAFPINGKFTKEQKLIYNAVLQTRNVVLENIRPGILWVDLNRLCQEEILRHLTKCGLLKGNVVRMFEEGLGYIFQPHGFGHFLGIDVFDIGGHSSCPGQPSKVDWIDLQVRQLQIGMVISVEPGCYFIDVLLEQALIDDNMKKYINSDVLEKYRTIGGIRLKDNILVTEEGYENFTNLPRTVKEIEEMLSPNTKFVSTILEKIDKIRELTNVKDLTVRLTSILDGKKFARESKILTKRESKESYNVENDCFPYFETHASSDICEEIPLDFLFKDDMFSLDSDISSRGLIGDESTLFDEEFGEAFSYNKSFGDLGDLLLLGEEDMSVWRTRGEDKSMTSIIEEHSVSASVIERSIKMSASSVPQNTPESSSMSTMDSNYS